MSQRLTEQERTQLVVDQLKELRDTRFGGNMSAMARELKLTNAYVGNVINGHRGIGLTLIDALARLKKCTIAAVLGERWSDDPQWPSVLEAVRAEVPLASDASLVWLGSLAGPLPPGDDPHVLGQIALAWDQARAKTAARNRATPPSTSDVPAGPTTEPEPKPKPELEPKRKRKPRAA